jgi:hypothetical protein
LDIVSSRVVIGLRSCVVVFQSAAQSPSKVLQCSLIRLQGIGLVGLWCKARVVRQRLVVASHQASEYTFRSQSSTDINLRFTGFVFSAVLTEMGFVQSVFG